MNITSVMVGMAMAGAVAPSVANMAIQPVVAQVRSENFAVAETAAVVFRCNIRRHN